jgi:hypothetical protein
MKRKQDKADTIQPIEDGKTYPLPNFMQVTGWGRHALRHARQKGLRVVKVSGRCFVRGKDFSDFLGRLSDDQEGGAA